MASTGPGAEAARQAFRAKVAEKGHTVDNARDAIAGLEAAIEAGALVRTPTLALMLADLVAALDQDEGQKLGGKSAEAARMIAAAISRELEKA